jgi:transcriptional regulator with GAF, ATPase, and Fis domain
MAAPYIVALHKSAEDLRRELARGLNVPATSDAWSCKILVADSLDHEALHRVQLALLDDLHMPASRTLLVHRTPCPGAERALVAMGIGDVIPHSEQALSVIRSRLQRWEKIDAALALPLVADNLVGTSPAWTSALRIVAECALFSSAAVLLTGPTGTGKELLARMLHSLDPQANARDLVIVDCTTLSRDLLGSELFGHERGAFTGAVGARDGAIACADGGTLFLDEVGELPLELQAQFLRVLQEKAYRRVGSSQWQRASFRLVCATNRDLAAEVEAGRFRADLFYRIAAMTCRTPALAQRRADIPSLVRHFIAGACAAGAAPEVSATLLDYLAARTYSGNVRELCQLVLACMRRYAGAGPLSLACLPDEEIQSWDLGAEPSQTDGPMWHPAYVDDFVRAALRANVGLKELGRMVEAAAVRLALEESESITAAASWLGVTPRALHLRKAAARGPDVRH